MPRSSMRATGAMPLASFRFEEGQCATLQPCCASSVDLVRLEVHGVHGDQAGAQQPQALQPLERPHAVAFSGFRSISSCGLVHVHVHRHVELAA